VGPCPRGTCMRGPGTSPLAIAIFSPTSAYIALPSSRSRMAVNPWESAVCALRAARIARYGIDCFSNCASYSSAVMSLAAGCRMGIDETRQNCGLRKVQSVHTGRRASPATRTRSVSPSICDQAHSRAAFRSSIDQLSRTDGQRGARSDKGQALALRDSTQTQ